jgi:hypothetical protein
MITAHEEFIVDLIKKNLVGVKLHNEKSGDAGRDFENKVEEFGIEVNRGIGIDSKRLGWEFKTRHKNATSAQTIGNMIPEDIIDIDNWYDTPISKKIKKQLRATLDKDSKIIDIELIDFDQPHIQDLFEEAYDHARAQLINDQDLIYTSHKGGYYGYFENTSPEKSKSLDWRISDNNMDKIKNMATSTFSDIFSYNRKF